MGVRLCFIMMRLWLAVFLVGISCGLKYIEEREVTTSSGKKVNCFYTIQYNSKGVVSTKKSSVTCTPDKNGGFAMPVFDLPGVGPTSIKHSVKKGKDSVQDFSPHAGPNNAAMPMNCSCRLPLSLDMMGSPGNKPNASQPMEEMEQMLEDMCSEGGKPEVLKELMEQMNITKEKVQQFMMASPDEKKEMIKNLMMSLPEEQKEFLKKIIQMIMGSGQMPPMGGGMKPPMGGKPPMGVKPPMGMGGKPKPPMGKPPMGMGGKPKPPMGKPPMGGRPPMGGGMKPPGMGGKPEGSNCQQQLMEMICSGKDQMGGKPGGMGCPKPGSMQQIMAGVKEMIMEMTGLTITEQGEAALDIHCECTPA